MTQKSVQEYREIGGHGIRARVENRIVLAATTVIASISD